jgi:hypothetical protein
MRESPSPGFACREECTYANEYLRKR